MKFFMTALLLIIIAGSFFMLGINKGENNVHKEYITMYPFEKAALAQLAFQAGKSAVGSEMTLEEQKAVYELCVRVRKLKPFFVDACGGAVGNLAFVQDFVSIVEFNELNDRMSLLSHFYWHPPIESVLSHLNY